MGRVEKYRQLRNLRQRFILSAALFIILVTAGICAADYSINGLMMGGSGLNLMFVNDKGNYIEIVFMNQKLYINTQYISRDIGRLKQEAAKLFGAN